MQVRLERIILFNFKSFKGKVTIGPFKPLTAIIGSNGSGKSNIMDAISFVMGEKSRSLRIKQLSDLIYGASVGNPIADRAHVTAVFIFEDNSKKTFTRAICGTSSEYKINDQVVAAQFYLSELRELNLNVKAGNFLVFQGGIENIATKTSKEYTSMIEQISNSIEMKEEYERLKSEVIKAEEEVQFIFKKKRDILMRKKFVLLSIEEANHYKMLHKQYLDTKRELQLFQLFHIEKDIEDLQETLSTVKLNINEHERDKELAIDLLRQKNKCLKEKLTIMENLEHDITKMENAFKQKEGDFAEVKGKVSYWQQQFDTTKLLSIEAHKSNAAHRKVIKELQNELLEVEHLTSMFEQNMITQLLSQQSNIELNDAQVQEYFRLKVAVELQSSEKIQLCNSLKSEQIVNQNNLDNEIRKKFELQTKLNHKKDEKNKYLINVKHVENIKNELNDKINAKNKLEEALIKQKEELEATQLELQHVSEQLGNAKLDECMISRLNKEANTIKLLQNLFPGVCGRLYNLCKPIHSRYQIAMTKVFGKYCNAIIVSTMNVAKECIHYLKEQQVGIETFLPLDSLKTKPAEERLRSITDPKNVKLLYDVLDFSPEINPAILFVTNNVLICETLDEARMLTFEANLQYIHNCVALDGTYFKKGGLISGGLVQLSQKAKVWQEQELQELRSKKMELTEKLREKMSFFRNELEMKALDVEIRGLTSRLKYSKLNLDEAENKLNALLNEIDITANELKTVNKNLTSIKKLMEEKEHEIQIAEKCIQDIEDEVFKTFCRAIGVDNIRQYEQGNLRIHQEQMERKMELEHLYNRIKNQLDYEENRDTESAVLKTEKNMRSAKQELENACQEEAIRKIIIKEELDKLNNLRVEYDKVKADVTEAEKSVNHCRKQIHVIERTIVNAHKEHSILMTNIRKKIAEHHAIIKNSKIENIPIPLLYNNSEDVQSSTVTTDASVNEEQRQPRDALPCIDFSKLSQSLKERTEINIDDLKSKFTSKLEKLQNELKSVENCNLKADIEVESLMEELKEINSEHLRARKKVTTMNREFEVVKKQRCDRFIRGLEHINTQIDIIYKSLVKDPSAQAVLLAENPEEPYLGGINYNCIAPGKRFQLMSNFSGGEKTVAALALLFAIHSFRPAPFLVLDEVDAALDNANIKNFEEFMRSRIKEIQFIIISLKHRLFAHTDALIGICSDLSGEYPESLVYTLSLEKYPSSRK